MNATQAIAECRRCRGDPVRPRRSSRSSRGRVRARAPPVRERTGDARSQRGAPRRTTGHQRLPPPLRVRRRGLPRDDRDPRGRLPLGAAGRSAATSSAPATRSPRSSRRSSRRTLQDRREDLNTVEPDRGHDQRDADEVGARGELPQHDHADQRRHRGQERDEERVGRSWQPRHCELIEHVGDDRGRHADPDARRRSQPDRRARAQRRRARSARRTRTRRASPRRARRSRPARSAVRAGARARCRR